MKKRVSMLLTVVLVLSLFVPTFAQEPVKVSVDGKILDFDVPPTIIEERTLVPVRAIFESLGVTVGWNKETRTVIGEKGNLKIELPVDNKFAKKGEEQIELDVPATIVDGRTMVPARFIAESVGAKVNWEGTTRTVVITSPKELFVHFIDVGQGDAILIEYEKFHALIDAGDNSAEDIVVNYLKEQNVDDLELFVATHSHADHIGGADAVLNAFDAEFIVDCDWIDDSNTFKDYKDAMIKDSSDGKTIYRNNDSDINIAINPDGSQPQYTESGDMTINIIGNQMNDDSNNSSTVVLLDIGDIEFLFTGDLEEEGEKALLNKLSDVEVLKVGHHGSRTATSLEFLNKVKPEVAVISAAENNKYGHPHGETIDKLLNNNVEIYGTWISGDIVVTTDGNTYNVNNEEKITTNNAEPSTKAPVINKEETAVVSQKSDVVIESIDLEGEIVKIKNNGTNDIDISGWKLVSVKGNQTYSIPSGTIIKAGAILTIASGKKATGDLKWSGAYIWNNDGDPGVLYDKDGNEVSRFE